MSNQHHSSDIKMMMMMGWRGGFFWQNGSLRARESLLPSKTPKVLHVTGVVSFPLLSSLKATNRICKSLGKANIIGYNILKALLIYGSYASG